MSGFVVIEGLDGVGKSTVVRELAALLSGHAMSTPGNDLRDMRQSVLQVFAEDQQSKALFYVVSCHSQGRLARHRVDEGEWVFMDRYMDSTVAYARARGVTTDFETLCRSLEQPDLRVLLHLDETERQARLGERGATAEDLETFDPGFRQCVLDEFHARADVVIDISGLSVADAVARAASVIRAELVGWAKSEV